MENQSITFDQEQADAIAEGYFTAMCGFNRPGEKFKAMLLDGLSLRDQLAGSFQIKAIISSFGPDAIREKDFKINNLKFECTALEQIDKTGVTKIFAYILTIGNMKFDSDSVLQMFYADTWGTAYVDAGRDLLREWISQEELYVSDSFGPGYYGMEMSQLEHFFKLLKAENIDVKLNGSTMMVPLKSCAGFFIAMKAPGLLPGEDCKSCLSEAKGCNFCQKRNKETFRADLDKKGSL